MIKLVFGSKNKIIKHEHPSFLQLKKSIKLNFPEVPFEYSLSYLDQDKDEICLNSNEDFSNMLNSQAKIYKIYIKQSLSQTIVIDVQRSDFIEPSFDNIIVIKQDKLDFILHKNLGKETLKQTTGIKVELNPIQKIHAQAGSVTYKETLPKNSIQEELGRLKTFPEQPNRLVMIPVLRQQAKIQQVIQQNPSFIKTIELQISPEKRVFSRVIDQSKGHSNEQEMMKIMHRAKIVEKNREIQKLGEALALHGVICSNCKDQFGILGIRYQCIFCNHFNLCSECEKMTDHAHALLKVKRPQQALNDGILIDKFKKEVYVPLQEKVIPADLFIPSIDKQNAFRILETARQSHVHGFMRSKHLLEQLFFKMQISHKNPYQMMKPILPLKLQTAGEKAQHLSDLVSISYKQAIRFVNQYPATMEKQKIVEKYFSLKK